MKKDGLILILLRYLFLVLIAIPNLFLFYKIFTPLTVYPVYFLLNLFFNASLNNTSIFINNLEISLINACIAGAGYYLLTILGFSIPMKYRKRIKLILLGFGMFLALNIVRIFVLSIMAIYGFSYFDITHKLLWYVLSTVFVVGIWFLNIKILNIKEIPFYEDLKVLYSQSLFSKKTKKSKTSKKN
jgi:exosortase/archaeosortase family protein